MSGPSCHAATVAAEASRYLAAVELFRLMGSTVQWRPETEEVVPARVVQRARRPRTCELCAGPLARINGRHVCLAP